MPVNPKSLANLRSGVGHPKYSEPKKRRSLSVTDTGWNPAKQQIKDVLGVSVSEMLEGLGRGKYKVIEVDD